MNKVIRALKEIGLVEEVHVQYVAHYKWTGRLKNFVVEAKVKKEPANSRMPAIAKATYLMAGLFMPRPRAYFR